jgi:integrase
MPRPKGSGINVARRRCADGSIKEYYYDRESGNFLGHSRAEAEAARARLPRPKGKPGPGTMAELVASYRASSHFRKDLAPATQELYGRYLDLIETEYGDLPVKGLTPSYVENIKLAYEETPRKANLLVAVLRIILRRAVKLRMIPSNPAAQPEMLPTPPREQIWSREDEARFLAAARPSLRLGFALLLYTVQRPSDVLAMTRGQVSERDGRLFVALRQQKTAALIDVPVHSLLEPLLRERLADPGGGMMLVPSPRGLAWSRRNFSRAWDQVAKRVGIAGLQRRDLRRTGIVRMAEAGATTPQIAAVSGHSIDYCQRIIDTYLPRRTEVALGGITAWEQQPARANVIRMGQRGRR